VPKGFAKQSKALLPAPNRPCAVATEPRFPMSAIGTKQTFDAVRKNVRFRG
jgi:hypothetical protein